MSSDQISPESDDALSTSVDANAPDEDRSSTGFVRLSARIMHDLRSPLNGMKSCLYRLERDIRVKEIDLDQRSLKGMKHFIRLMEHQLLRFGIELNIKSLTIQRCNLSRCLFDVISSLESEMESHGFKLDRISIDGLHRFPDLYVDERWIGALFRILISNSLKNSHSDPEDYRLHIEFDCSDDQFFLYFRDWGIGLTDRQAMSAFLDPADGGNSGRAQSVVDPELWIARQIALAHGGGIKVSNASLPMEIAVWFPRSSAFPQEIESKVQ